MNLLHIIIQVNLDLPITNFSRCNIRMSVSKINFLSKTYTSFNIVTQKRASFTDGIMTNGLNHPDPSILASLSETNQNISATHTNANAINSIVTIVTDHNCSRKENDGNDKISIPSAENV